MLSINEETNSINITDNSSENLSKTLLAINRAYQEVITEKIDKLKALLRLNKDKQNEILEKVSNRNLNSAQQFKTETLKFEVELNKIKGSYFKDRFQSEPDDNVDTIRRNKLAYYDYVPQLKSEWTIEYRNKLKQAVITDSIRIIKNPFTNKIKYLEEKFYKIAKSEDRKPGEMKSVQVMLRECRNQLKKIDLLTEDNVLDQIDPQKIDWFKISNVDLGGNWSSTECQLVWINVCNPKINQSKWTPAENSKLIDLARQFREKNWEQISFLLNTNRSAFLCMKRYHEKTADKYCKRDWTEEETNELLELAEKHRQGLFVPYNYICYLNGTRDRNTVYNYHLKIDPNLNHGRWTASEDQAFEEAIQYYSAKNWQEISEYIGSRTAFQCKERYELKYLNPDKYKNWSLEEDKKLLELVDEHGGQWSKIAASEFPHRTDHSCLFRYTKLMNWKRQNEWFDSQSDYIQEFILFLFRKRNKKVEEDVQVYTNKGELVPTSPKFGAGTGFLASIIDKIFEKKDLVAEFIEKKRDGQLSLTLLAKIGIYTPVINSLIAKYKKYHLRQNEEAKTETSPKPSDPKKKKRISKSNSENQPGTSLGLGEDKPNPENSQTKLETDRIKRKYVKKTSVKINKILPPEVSSNQKNSQKVSYYLKKKILLGKSEKVKNKKYVSQIDSKSNIEELFPRKKNKKDPKDDKLRISQILDMKNGSIESVGDSNQTENSNESNQIEASCSNKDLLTTENETNKENTETINEKKRKLAEDSSILQEPKPKRKYKQRQKKTPDLKINETHTDSKKTPQKVKVPKAQQVRKSPKLVETPKYVEKIQELTNIRVNDDNPLLVDITSIDESMKIACFTEYPNEFKYMYSLKKDAKFIKQFTIIKCKETLVGIKPFNKVIDKDYFTQLRLKAIENAMKKVALLK